MRHTVTHFWVLAVSFLSVFSCADPPTSTAAPASPAKRPNPAVTVTVTATPTPTSKATPAEGGEVYRLRAEFLGTSDVTFEVSLNGQKVGSFNADATNDITPLVRQGSNRVEVRWRGQHEADEYSKAQLFLESQRPGQEGWNSLFSREVGRKTREEQATGNFDVGSPVTSPRPLLETTPEPVPTP